MNSNRMDSTQSKITAAEHEWYMTHTEGAADYYGPREQKLVDKLSEKSIQYIWGNYDTGTENKIDIRA